MAEIPKKTGTFRSFDDTPVYYEVRGEGKPIVLCYGIACLANHWTHQLKHFSKNYQTIVFDYRGHHKTPAPLNRDELSIEAIARDMKALLDHLGIPSASCWGHSYGVQILLKFFEMFPQSVSNLVFVNGFASNPVKGMFGIDAMGSLFSLFKNAYEKSPSAVSMVWKVAVNNPIAIRLSTLAGGFNSSLTSLKDIEVYARGVSAMDIDVFITLFEQMMAFDGFPILSTIDKPTLIISGSKDGVTPQEFQEEMHRQIEGSEFLSVPYGSHCTQLDLPEFVNLRIEKFLHENDYSPDKSKPKKPALSSTKTAKTKGKRKPARPWRADL